MLFFSALNLHQTLKSEVRRLRFSGLVNPHQPGSVYWPIIPHFFGGFNCVFYEYWNEVARYSALFIGRPLFIGGNIALPVPVTPAVRKVIYDIFLTNSPLSIWTCFSLIRFRFHFSYNPHRSYILVEDVTLFPAAVPAFYPGDPFT